MARAEGAEVARVRELLESRFGAVPAGPPPCPAPAEGGADGPAACLRQPRSAQKQAGEPSQGALMAHVEPPGDGDSGARGFPLVVWRPAGPGACADGGRRQVPKALARAFGAGERAFSSLADLESALDAIARQAAFSRVVDLVKARDRPSSQLRRRLESEGFSPGQASAAVERAERCGLVSDERFSESYVAAKARAGWGRRRIERELFGMGLDAPRDGDAGQALTDEAERERAWAAVSRRPVPSVRPVEKLARFLVGRGFSADVALGAARRRVDEAGGAGDVMDEA